MVHRLTSPSIRFSSLLCSCREMVIANLYSLLRALDKVNISLMTSHNTPNNCQATLTEYIDKENTIRKRKKEGNCEI